MTIRPSTKHNIQRDDENTNRPGFAVVQKILVTGSIFAESTGVDSGTGDVLLLVSGTVTNGDSHNHNGGDGGPIPEAIASAISLGSNKNPPVAADSLAISDTEDSNSFKRLTLGTLRSFLRTNFDTVYAPITGAFVQDEGVIQGRVTTFNFVGSPVDVSVSGSVARIFVTGSSGSSGGMTLISEVVLNADGPISFTDIPGTYRELKLFGMLRSNRANVGDRAGIRFNGDSGSNYYSTANQVNDTATWAVVEGLAVSSVDAFNVTGDTAISGSFASLEVFIPYYAVTVFQKTVQGYSWHSRSNASSNQYFGNGGGRWNNTAAITRIDVVPTNGGSNWRSGSRVALYGIT